MYTELNRWFQMFKDWAPLKCTCTNKPFFLTVKPLPTPPWLDPRDRHKDDKSSQWTHKQVNAKLHQLWSV